MIETSGAAPDVHGRGRNRPLTKQCPACGEALQVSARICRYCGHWFGATAEEPEFQSTKGGPTQPVTPRTEQQPLPGAVGQSRAASSGKKLAQKFGLRPSSWSESGSSSNEPPPLPPAPPSPPAAPDETFEVNRAGVGLALAGAALVLIAIFLPRVESNSFFRVEKNTLIQSGDGWILIALAVGIAAAVWRVLVQQRKMRTVAILGLIAIAVAVYDGTGDRVRLASLADPSQTEKASPGIGIYAAGLGGALAAIGGAWMAGLAIGAAGQGVPTRRTKKCPDCAETVLADARVCKHCGNRFA